MTDDRDGDDTIDTSLVPPPGSTLIVGPSGVGKTRLTADLLESYISAFGTDGVVVLEFGPSIVRDGDIVGGRLDRFVDIPEDVWLGVLESHAARLRGKSDAESRELARSNAERARKIFDAMPDDPAAVFVNDATIPFQHEYGDPGVLTRYCDRAERAVINAYEGEGLGTDDPVSVRERTVLRTFRAWADAIVRLE